LGFLLAMSETGREMLMFCQIQVEIAAQYELK